MTYIIGNLWKKIWFTNPGKIIYREEFLTEATQLVSIVEQYLCNPQLSFISFLEKLFCIFLYLVRVAKSKFFAKYFPNLYGVNVGQSKVYALMFVFVFVHDTCTSLYAFVLPLCFFILLLKLQNLLFILSLFMMICREIK